MTPPDWPDTPTLRAEEWFERLARTLDLPDVCYESADTSYRSVARWLERDESAFAGTDMNVYTQGSFRLGTALAPLERDDYDLDIVCEFHLEKLDQTQEQLYERLGRELRLYAERYGMDRPEGWERCWTLNYAETTRFHMDVLPCIPDGQAKRMLLEQASLSPQVADGAVAITDRQHPAFRVRGPIWPVSNPNGYADWFKERMRLAFNRRRAHMRLVEAKANVDDIPEFRVRTPLQFAVQVLKRHRDVYFLGKNAALRPTSIIITTLAAMAYNQESTVLTALLAIVEAMPVRMKRLNGQYSLPNPSDPRENFADSWNDRPERADAFLDWAIAARHAVHEAASTQDLTRFTEALAPALGRTLVEASVGKTSQVSSRGAWRSTRILDARHRQTPPWPVNAGGHVTLSATRSRDGFRRVTVVPNGENLPRHWDLHFVADTNVPPPYDVYWQVVNTGVAATDADGLRGGFDPSLSVTHRLESTESTLYPGSHSMECFIVKNGFVAAQSGLFIVNIGHNLS